MVRRLQRINDENGGCDIGIPPLELDVGGRDCVDSVDEEGIREV